MRIITEDNIQQLENMSFSKNIDRLMFSENIEPQVVVNEIKKILSGAPKGKEVPPDGCETVGPVSPEASPEYAQGSPAYQPDMDNLTPYTESSSPLYNPLGSPQEFSPHSPESPPPKEFSPRSPESPPSKEFSPHSPEGPPPMTGGERVHYRGDKLPTRLWTVKNVGDEFITIETDNPNGLSPEDIIKVVERGDLYKEGDFSYDAVVRPHEHGVPILPNSQTSQVVPAGIHFAPVIKINNGGYDYSLNGEEPGNAAGSAISMAPPEVIPSITSPIKLGAPNDSIVIKKEAEKKEEKSTGGDSGGGGILTGIKDFFIKKLG